ncbi:MAG: hypothetical protein ACHQF2_00775 [Flavobacteriales bacterium]
MSKPVSTHLHELITTLTGSEKRYFHLFAQRHVLNGQNQYERIFDEIESQPAYDETEIVKLLKLNTKLFPDQKRNLYEMVLKSLSAFHSENTVDARLSARALNIQILYQKGLFKQCHTILKKLITECEQYEKFHLLFELLQFERRLIFSDLIIKKAEARLKENYQETEFALGILKKMAKLTELSSEIYLTMRQEDFVRSEKLKKKTEDLYNQLLSQGVDRNDPFLLQIEYYKALTFYSYTIGQLKDCIKYSYFQVELLESHNWYFEENPRAYLIFYYNLCLSLVENNAFKELKKIQPRLTDGRFQKGNFKSLSYWLNFEISLVYFLRSGEIQKGFRFIEEEKNRFNQFEKQIHPTYRYQLCFNAASVCFIYGKYRESLYWLNKILHSADAELENKYYFDFATILNMLVHVDLLDFDYLEYVIQHVRRKLRKKEPYQELENMIFRFVVKVVKEMKVEQPLIKSLKSKLDEWAVEPANRNLLKTFDFVAWCNARINKKPLEDIYAIKELNIN